MEHQTVPLPAGAFHDDSGLLVSPSLRLAATPFVDSTSVVRLRVRDKVLQGRLLRNHTAEMIVAVTCVPCLRGNSVSIPINILTITAWCTFPSEPLMGLAWQPLKW